MIGIYSHGRSYMHLLDPRTKLALMVGMSLLIYSAQPPALAVLLALVLLLSRASGLPYTRLVQGLRPVLVFFGVIFLTYLLFTPGEPLIEGLAVPTVEGVTTGSVLVLRFILLILYTSIMTYSTSPSGLNYALTFFLRPFGTFGNDLAFMTGTAMTLIPGLFREKDTITKAQAARGYKPRGMKGFTALVVPLMNRSLKRVDELSDALESRCFHSKRRYYYYRQTLANRDYAAVGIYVVLAGVVLFVRFEARF
ncbi:MAG: energy-coupling factor transporter transmembrane protein EcfT [Methanosarcinales archaeon]|nr:energy-coupling factor transporter transmembrane protein EcfT [Methanosarcinales archaeon]